MRSRPTSFYGMTYMRLDNCHRILTLLILIFLPCSLRADSGTGVQYLFYYIFFLTGITLLNPLIYLVYRINESASLHSSFMLGILLLIYCFFVAEKSFYIIPVLIVAANSFFFVTYLISKKNWIAIPLSVSSLLHIAIGVALCIPPTRGRPVEWHLFACGVLILFSAALSVFLIYRRVFCKSKV
jgi:hypothetical protein